MKIQNMRSGPDDGRGTMRLRAVFDLELTDEIRLYGLQLMQAPDGSFRTWAPSLRGVRSVTFAHAMVRRITELAIIKLEAQNANGVTRAA